MAFLQEKMLVMSLLIFCMALVVSSRDRRYTPPTVTHLTDDFPPVSIDKGFSNFYGGSNIKLLSNGSTASLALDKSSGKITHFTRMELDIFSHLKVGFSVMYICVNFYRIRNGLEKQILLWILQCCN